VDSSVAPSRSTVDSAASMSSTWMSRWICCGKLGSGHSGGRNSGASWKLSFVLPSPMSIQSLSTRVTGRSSSSE
jgi:hypothetical protein